MIGLLPEKLLVKVLLSQVKKLELLFWKPVLIELNTNSMLFHAAEAAKMFLAIWHEEWLLFDREMTPVFN